MPAKPISNFVERWERLITRVLDTRDIRRIGIVGAGAGGVEMQLAMQFRLGQLPRQAGGRITWNIISSAALRPFSPPTIHVSRQNSGVS